jgi:hypothetical protein
MLQKPLAGRFFCWSNSQIVGTYSHFYSHFEHLAFMMATNNPDFIG